jgi:hypothetical protein
MEVLSGLESANFMGRLLVHKDIIHQCLLPTPESLATWSYVRDTFHSEITKSALDPTVNPFCSSPSMINFSSPLLVNGKLLPKLELHSPTVT